MRQRLFASENVPRLFSPAKLHLPPYISPHLVHEFASAPSITKPFHIYFFFYKILNSLTMDSDHILRPKHTLAVNQQFGFHLIFSSALFN